MKRKFYLLTTMMLMGMTSAYLNAQQWTVFDGSVSPDSVFSWDNGSGTLTDTILDDPKLPGNKIYQFDVAGGTGNWRATFDASMGGLTVVARVKAYQTTDFQAVNFRISNGLVRPDIRVEDDKLNPGGTKINANHNLDMYKWKVIRMTLIDSTIHVYVDEDPVAVMNDTGTASVSTNYYFQWGDGSGSDNYAAQVDWIIFDTTGVYAPGEGAAIPDSLALVTPIRIAYLTEDKGMDAQAAPLGEDDIVKMFQADRNFDITVYLTARDAVVDLSSYDLVIAQEGYNSGSAIFQAGGSLDFALIPSPFIYNKTYALRNTKALTSGGGTAGESADGVALTVDPANKSNVLFNGIKFSGNTFNAFNATTSDGGGTGTKAINYVQDLYLSDGNTLLGYISNITNADSAVVVNDIPAGTTIGDRATLNRGVFLGMNFGSISLPGNLTREGLTLWRNAAYSLVGLDVPTTLYDGPVSRGIEAYWAFDEGAGEKVKDAFGMSDGVLSNGVAATWTEGLVGGALDFTQVSDPDTTAFVTVPGDLKSVDKDSTQSFSISLLAKVKEDIVDGVEQSIFAKGVPFADNGGWYHLSFKYNANQAKPALRFMIWDDATETMTSPVGLLPDDFKINEWVHIVCVRDRAADMVRVYLDGELLDESADNTDRNIASDGDFYIGAIPHWGNYFHGCVDEFKMFNVALTADEIRDMAIGYGLTFIAPSDDATLSDLKVDGSTVNGFASDKYSYDVELPAGTTTVPTVEATPADTGASVTITAASALPGSTTVDVTAEDGVSTHQYVVNFTVAPSGIEIKGMASISIYPNPVRDELTVTNAGNSTISIFELSGALVRTISNPDRDVRIDVSELGTGMYLIKVQTGVQIVVSRFVKE